MQKHGLVLEFTATPVTVSSQISSQPGVAPLVDMAQKVKMKVSAVAVLSQSSEGAIDDCAVPIFTASTTYEMPNCNDPHLSSLLKEHKDLFRMTLGKTMVTEHYIPTNGTLIKIPPC